MLFRSHGHSHQTEESIYEFMIEMMLRAQGFNPEIYNVGCMYWNYEPVTLDEILAHKQEIMDCEMYKYLKFFKLNENEIDIGEDIKTRVHQAIQSTYYSIYNLTSESEEDNG